MKEYNRINRCFISAKFLFNFLFSPIYNPFSMKNIGSDPNILSPMLGLVYLLLFRLNGGYPNWDKSPLKLYCDLYMYIHIYYIEILTIVSIFFFILELNSSEKKFQEHIYKWNKHCDKSTYLLFIKILYNFQLDH